MNERERIWDEYMMDQMNDGEKELIRKEKKGM